MGPTTGSPPRFRKHGLFRLIGYAPHPGQLLVHQSRAQRRVLACGVRWGKTTCGVGEAVAALLEPRESALGWVVAPNYGLADKTFRQVADAIQAHFCHRVQVLDLRGQRLVVTNLGGGTSELRGKSADEPVSLLGESLDFLIVDEAAKLRSTIWENHLSQRLIDRRGWVLFLSTPSGCNWFYRLFHAAKTGKDPVGEAWQSPSAGNPHLDKMAIEAERTSLPADVFQQEYEAKFLGIEQEPCEVCGWPDPEAESFITLYDGEEDPGDCSACGHPVGPDGTSIPWGAMFTRCEGKRPMGKQWAWGRWVDAYGHPLPAEA